ncbi:MAG: flagellar export chaperone FlgN [Bdellovibrionales bacterium]|nr:flagellar export chaperone FlgN [Bdellovibrionales bacterium]
MTPISNPELTSKLKSLIEAEIKLYQEYISLQSLEAKQVRKLRGSKEAQIVSGLTAKRRIMAQQMSDFHEQRLVLLERIPGSSGRRLTDIISESMHPRDAAQLLPLARRLREVISESRKQAFEFKRILGFSSKIVNGMLSMLLAASQNIVKGYTAKGKAREKYQPSGSRNQGVIKQA